MNGSLAAATNSQRKDGAAGGAERLGLESTAGHIGEL